MDEVVEKGKRFILIRDSFPQAAIVPYDDLIKEEENWQREFQKLAAETKPYFRNWLKKNKIRAKDLTEEKLYGLINKTASRY